MKHSYNVSLTCLSIKMKNKAQTAKYVKWEAALDSLDMSSSKPKYSN